MTRHQTTACRIAEPFRTLFKSVANFIWAFWDWERRWNIDSSTKWSYKNLTVWRLYGETVRRTVRRSGRETVRWIIRRTPQRTVLPELWACSRDHVVRTFAGDSEGALSSICSVNCSAVDANNLAPMRFDSYFAWRWRIKVLFILFCIVDVMDIGINVGVASGCRFAVEKEEFIL